MKCTWYLKFSFLFLAIAVSQAYGQKVNVQAYLDAYPQQPFVYLNKSEQVKISIKDKKFSVIEHHHEELLILKSNLNSIRSKKVRTNAFIDIQNLKAYIYVYNGKSHSKSRLTSIDLKSENDGDETFYDDDQFYYIHFSEAKEGDIITIDYDTDFKEPRFFGAFFFSDYYT